jgi:hypothetical protein
LGGGWTVALANAVDSNGVAGITNGTYVNPGPTRRRSIPTATSLTSNLSINVPVGLSGGSLSAVLTFNNQTGFLDPFATDGNGDPSPTNIPAHRRSPTAMCRSGRSTTPDAALSRSGATRTERVQMLLQSDLQPIIVRPEVEQNSETIVKPAPTSASRSSSC